ncbi:MurR/RpiR family transcriptional regulator [Salinicoccus bachuensis]|uniref:MurR/RpiR family transcriptional regulator n=1 Tax=Salinicoccus bachuensis TaxID=3136731 RepID=A0ABZ3CKT4_9STAP
MTLFEKIQNSINEVSEAKKRVAYYILDNWLEAAFTTARKVSIEANVSESVVVRYSQDLGFTGFPELQKEIQKMAKNRLSLSFTTGKETEPNNVEGDFLEINDEIRNVYNSEIRNLNSIMYNNNLETFINFKNDILNANKILILARKNSYGPAEILNGHINEIFSKSILINGETIEALDYIRGLSEEDLVIFISIPSISKRMEDFSNYVKERNVKQIAITNNHFTNISKNAHTLLATYVDSLSFSNSHIGTIFIIDIINYLLTTQEGPTIFKNIEEMKLLNERFGLTKDNNL